MQIDLKNYVSINEYANKYGITRQTVYNKIRSGEIRPIKIGSQQFIKIK